jgi:polysaccharide export outer membrane protein
MRLLAMLMATLALAGCSAIPNVGPSTDDVAQQAGSTPADARYEFVDIDASVVDVLRRRAPDSFRTNFGDYRPSVEPKIGIGDYVSVTVWEAGAGGLFSAPLMTDRFSTGSKSATIPDQAVGRDGAISVPYAGRVRVLGRSTAEVQIVVEKALEGKAIQPQVLVNVTRPISNTATVGGEVTQGARVPLSMKGDRLLDVVATAGGIRAPVNETFVQLARGERTARVALSRVVSDPRENIYIRPGDVLTLVREPQVFIAYGATGRNAEVPFDADGITLSQALAKAGGLIDSRSDPAGVFIFRYEPEGVARQLRPNSSLIERGRMTPVVYRLNLRDANNLFIAQNFRIFSKDVIYVSNASLTDVQKVLQIFNMVASPAATGASIYTGFK